MISTITYNKTYRHLKMSEDIYFTPESKLGIIMRANVDVINAVSAMEHYEESL